MSRRSNKLTAADIMQKDVVTVGPEESLREALELMIENHITGLPVLDQKSRCVGLISAMDILGYEQDHAQDAAEANAEMARYFDPDTQRWEDVRVTAFALEEFAETPVAEIMSRDIVSVDPETSLSSVAALMIEQQIHRVLVMDEEKALLGLISSVDFVQLYADSQPA